MEPRKIAIAASTDIELNRITAQIILGQLRDLPKDIRVVLLRRPRGGYPSAFEAFVSSLASSLEFEVEWCVPGVGGRSAVFLRDVEMVQKADEVLCFFPPEHIMEGGTGHIVEKAMDQDKIVRAYALSSEGLRWIGGSESKEP